jgi:hypothetical protein
MESNQSLAKVSAAEARRFLKELVNLQATPGAERRIKRRFKKFLPFEQNKTVIDMKSVDARDVVRTDHVAGSVEMSIEYNWVLACRDALRVVWETRDAQEKIWGLICLREHVARPLGFSLLSVTGPPPPTAFDQAVLYLLTPNVRTRQCKNPDCAAPYFFAMRRNQKYCSGDCLSPVQRAYKRRWWQEHGDEWRRKRNEKSKRRKKK